MSRVSTGLCSFELLDRCYMVSVAVHWVLSFCTWEGFFLLETELLELKDSFETGLRMIVQWCWESLSGLPQAKVCWDFWTLGAQALQGQALWESSFWFVDSQIQWCWSKPTKAHLPAEYVGDILQVNHMCTPYTRALQKVHEGRIEKYVYFKVKIFHIHMYEKSAKSSCETW